MLVVQLSHDHSNTFSVSQARDETGNFLRSTITRYYSSSGQPDAVNLVWNQLMTDMHCCGVHDYRDFETAPKWNATRGDRVVPEQCCKRTDDGSALVDAECVRTPNEQNSYFETVRNR